MIRTIGTCLSTHLGWQIGLDGLDCLTLHPRWPQMALHVSVQRTASDDTERQPHIRHYDSRESTIQKQSCSVWPSTSSLNALTIGRFQQASRGYPPLHCRTTKSPIRCPLCGHLSKRPRWFIILNSRDHAYLLAVGVAKTDSVCIPVFAFLCLHSCAKPLALTESRLRRP